MLSRSRVCLPWLMRRPTVSAAATRGSGGGIASICFGAVREGRAGLKHRSLSPDDPFGERSSWEDPSDGVYAAWKDVDQDGFVAAAESDEVRRAHFGPAWSRFTTVGRLSVKMMQEDPRHLSRVEGEPSAYPTAEDLHAKELAAKKQMMTHNYATYEAFLAGEMGGGGNAHGMLDDAGSDADGAEGCGNQQGVRVSTLLTEAQRELAFSEVEGLDGKDRMAVRNPVREALTAAEAAVEGGEDVELPAFMQRPEHAQAIITTSSAAATSPSPTTPAPPKEASPHDAVSEESAATPLTCPRSASTEVKRPDATAPLSNDGPPGGFTEKVLAALPVPHGDGAIPLQDPAHWQTEHIVRFLQLFENGGDGMCAASASSLDASMVDAFHLARVDGEVLLNVVTPPRLFRVLRRWHVRRQEAVMHAWRLHRSMDETAAIREATEMAAPRLAEAVAPVTPLLIQETILLCFPYAR